MSEDDLLTVVLDTARLNGWRCYHVRNSRAGIVQGDVGYPDLTMVRDGRLIVAELKRQSGRLTPPQQTWLAVLGAVPCVEVYTWRPSDWVDGTIERKLGR